MKLGKGADWKGGNIQSNHTYLSKCCFSCLANWWVDLRLLCTLLILGPWYCNGNPYQKHVTTSWASFQLGWPASHLFNIVGYTGVIIGWVVSRLGWLLWPGSAICDGVAISVALVAPVCKAAIGTCASTFFVNKTWHKNCLSAFPLLLAHVTPWTPVGYQSGSRE